MPSNRHEQAACLDRTYEELKLHVEVVVQQKIDRRLDRTYEELKPKIRPRVRETWGKPVWIVPMRN